DLGQGVRVVLGQAEFVEHVDVVEAPAQALHPAQLALQIGQAAGDLLRLGLVVPQVRRRGLLVEPFDLGPQRVEVHHRLDRGHRGLEVLELFSKVYRHSNQAYAKRATRISTSGRPPYRAVPRSPGRAVDADAAVGVRGGQGHAAAGDRGDSGRAGRGDPGDPG